MKCFVLLISGLLKHMLVHRLGKVQLNFAADKAGETRCSWVSWEHIQFLWDL